MPADEPADSSGTESRSRREQRKTRPSGRTRDGGRFTLWLVDTAYYGLFQVWMLGVPGLAIAWLAQASGIDVPRGVVTAWVVASVGVGLRRRDVAGLGRGWPALRGADLGGGAGYRPLLVRSVYWSATFLVAGFGGALAGQVGPGHAITAVGVAVGAGSVALLPALVADTRTARVGRLGFAAASLALAAAVARPLATDVPVRMSALFALFALLVLADARSLLRPA